MSVEIFRHIVQGIDTNVRINDYCINPLSEYYASRKAIKKAISRGEVLLNHKRIESSRYISNGDIISIVQVSEKLPKPYPLNLKIIYEDDEIAAILKPAGISVSGNEFRTIQNAIINQNIQSSNQKDALRFPVPVHRLDNQTSGILLIAKTSKSAIHLNKQFANRKVKKTYHALVIGKTPKVFEIHTPIENKPSTTLFKTLKIIHSNKNEYLSLIEAKPLTGRTHQIRIHLSKNGFPILGDKIYGKDGFILKHKGLFLCAVRLCFTHPITNKNITLNIKTPNKFISFMNGEERRWQKYHG